MRWQGGKGGRIVRWQDWRGGTVKRRQGGKVGRVVRWQGGRFLVLFEVGDVQDFIFLFLMLINETKEQGVFKGWKDSP